MTDKKSWYLIHTKPKQEQIALENLQRQHYEAYLPMAEIQKRRQGRHQNVIEPMFPRYLFISLDKVNDNWVPIRSTRGVQALVRFGGVPAKVPDDLVNKIRELEVRSESVEAIPGFTKGSVVRILEGVFAGYEGVFEEHSSERRATILLLIADRYTRVQLAVDDVDLV